MRRLREEDDDDDDERDDEENGNDGKEILRPCVWAYKILLVLVIGLEKLWKPRLYCSGESEHT